LAQQAFFSAQQAAFPFSAQPAAFSAEPTTFSAQQAAFSCCPTFAETINKAVLNTHSIHTFFTILFIRFFLIY
jgi:hypothetical protein